MLHKQLILFGRHLGYKSISKSGLCKGFSAMWVQAVCAGDLPAFNRRLHLLGRYVSEPAQLVDEIKRVQQLKKAGLSLSTQQEDLLEIPAFYEGIALYLNPNIGFEMAGKKMLFQSNEIEISEFVRSE